MSEFKRKPLTEEASWIMLKDLYAKYGSTLNMRQLFAEEKNRFETYKYRNNLIKTYSIICINYIFFFNFKKI
jgi:hypothetical protein